MRNYREIYITSFMVGEGLSGIIPSCIAAIQGIGFGGTCNPVSRFSSGTFFLILATIQLMCLISFVCMNNLQNVQSERVKDPSKNDPKIVTSDQTNIEWTMSKQTYCVLWLIMGSLSFFQNGIMLSVQPYSSKPYGDMTHRLTAILTTVASPLAMATKFFVKTPGTRLLSILYSIALVLSLFLISLAAQSPEPLWRDYLGGSIMVVMVWVVLRGLTGFVQMGIISVFRGDPGQGLFYTGLLIQVGASLGAFASVIMISVLKIFTPYDNCPKVEH